MKRSKLFHKEATHCILDAITNKPILLYKYNEKGALEVWTNLEQEWKSTFSSPPNLVKFEAIKIRALEASDSYKGVYDNLQKLDEALSRVFHENPNSYNPGYLKVYLEGMTVGGSRRVDLSKSPGDYQPIGSGESLKRYLKL